MSKATRARVLVVMHAGVVAANRALLWELARVAHVEIKLLVPERWKGDLIQELSFVSEADDKLLSVLAMPVRFSGNGSLFFFSGKIRRALAGWVPDQIFLFQEPWSLCAAQVIRAFPRVQCSFVTLQNIRKTIPLPFRLLEKWVFKKSSHAFAGSKEIKEVLKVWKGYTKEVRYLPFSFDPSKFKPTTPAARSRFKREHGIPVGSKLVAYFGRLTMEKGISELLASIQEICSQAHSQEIHFLVVGNGPMAVEINTLAQRLPGRLTVLEAVPHAKVHSVMACIDLLVLPSRTTRKWKEQFGRVLIEAMACGAVTIGSNSGEIPFLIERTGGGVVFPEGDSGKLSAAILKLARDQGEFQKLQANALRSSHELFTHEVIAGELARGLGLELRS